MIKPDNIVDKHRCRPSLLFQWCFKGCSQIAEIGQHQHIRRLFQMAFIINSFVMSAAMLRRTHRQNALVIVGDDLMRRSMAFLFAE